MNSEKEDAAAKKPPLWRPPKTKAERQKQARSGETSIGYLFMIFPPKKNSPRATSSRTSSALWNGENQREGAEIHEGSRSGLVSQNASNLCFRESRVKQPSPIRYLAYLEDNPSLSHTLTLTPPPIQSSVGHRDFFSLSRPLPPCHFASPHHLHVPAVPNNYNILLYARCLHVPAIPNNYNILLYTR